MKWLPAVRAHENVERIPACDGSLHLEVRLCMEQNERDAVEYHAEVVNVSDHPVWLESVTLADLRDLTVLGLQPGPYRIFRSGRHKNDLPGVFETGCLDERLRDVSSVMAEAGDHVQAGDSLYTVVSDHMTLIRDEEGLCLAISFLTGRDQLVQTCLELDRQGHFTGLRAETLFQVLLDPGATVRTETIRLALTGNVREEMDAFALRKGKLYGTRTKRQPAVYCTWYYYGLTVTYEDVMRNLSIIRERRLPYDVFQIDEGWEITLGEYEPNHKFPVSMRELADRIRDAGLVPGLWSSPFVAHETASVWKAHPEWILRDSNGDPCLFPMNGTVYYVFDITDPATWDYFRQMYHRFTFEWGYSYHKLDFTRAAVIYDNTVSANPRITKAQAYYQAVKAIREGMGEEAFFLMCGGLYDPIIGLVDAQRTGSDVLSMWSSSVNRDGRTVPYTVRQSLNRYYMNQWWANDPDALMIRRNETMERGLRLTYGLLNEHEVRTVVVNQFAGGGILCQTEPLDRIDEDRLMELRHIYPVFEREVHPLNLMSGERFPGAFDVYVRKTDVHCVCLMNWSDTEEMEVTLCMRDLKLSPSEQYVVCDFYSGEFRTGIRAEDTVSFTSLKPHAATVIKVAKQEKKPIIVASDGHFSMGAELDQLEIREDRLHVRKPALFPVKTHYRILLPEGVCDRETVVDLVLEPGQEEATLLIPAEPKEKRNICES